MTKRERQRYVKFKIYTATRNSTTFNGKAITRSIWRKFTKLYGEIESSKAGFWLMEYDPAERVGTIRCSHLVLAGLVTTLTLLRELDGTPVSFDTLSTSGILGKL
ncbi:hypothetical protein GF325_17285 [Candidatus Bathyarchaeota archaeon]|nr:hypothetical protein [Candidatus Bathyarchaeota archaeon]